MATPPPIQDPMNSQRWLEWFRLISLELNEITSVQWSNISFTGSNITDIVSRAHNNLQSIQGGSSTERYHLTAAQHAALSAGDHNDLTGLQGGTTNEYYHLTNDQHSGITGTTTVAGLPGTPSAGQRHMVTDANATTFHSVVASGGSNVVPVFYDGTNWRIG